jgi:DMSO/TMAO reductase YedYZ heme-binding membrane subunit
MLEKTVYLLLVGLIVALEHILVGTKWPEEHRRAMGIITVMGLSFGLVWLNVYESALDCWLWTFFGFGLAGTVLIGLDTLHTTHTRQAAVNQLEALRNDEQNIQP